MKYSSIVVGQHSHRAEGKFITYKNFVFWNLFHNHLDKGNQGPDRKMIFLFFPQPLITTNSILPHGLGIKLPRALKPLKKSFTPGNHWRLRTSHYRSKEACQLKSILATNQQTCICISKEQGNRLYSRWLDKKAFWNPDFLLFLKLLYLCALRKGKPLPSEQSHGVCYFLWSQEKEEKKVAIQELSRNLLL